MITPKEWTKYRIKVENLKDEKEAWFAEGMFSDVNSKYNKWKSEEVEIIEFISSLKDYRSEN